MKFRRGTLPDVLFTTCLYLLRRRIRTKIDSFTKRGKDAYENLSDLHERTSRSISRNDHRPFSRFGSLLLGVGVGLGVGVLIAPASGDETRAKITK
jgi:gas vesicle protein